MKPGFYTQVWWTMARKTVLSNVMLLIFGMLLLSYGIGSIVYYIDPQFYVPLGLPKNQLVVNKFLVGVPFFGVVFFFFILVYLVGSLFLDLYKKSEQEVLQKMEHDEKARRIGLTTIRSGGLVVKAKGWLSRLL